MAESILSTYKVFRLWYKLKLKTLKSYFHI
jgi:hypothetical protein